MPSLAQRLYGSDEVVAPARALRAGPLSMELQRGRLRRICCGGHEVWHGLAWVLRDADWGTPEPVLGRVDIQEAADAFEVCVEGHWPAPATVAFRLRIAGHADGAIRFDA